MIPARRSRRRSTTSGEAPPAWLEYAFHGVVAYGVLAVALGVSVPGLAGAVLVVLAAACIFRSGPRAVRLYRPIAAPLGAAALFVIIQLAVHRESSQDVRPYVVWAVTLIIVHSLSWRIGFFGRFVGMAVLVGVAVLPYMQFMSGGLGVERAGLDRAMALGGLSNANDLAAWFGFCAIWLTVAGIESKHHRFRAAWWTAAVACLYIVALTVSRGTALAFAVAATAASRRLLSRGFVPAMCLVVVAGISYEAGVFQKTADMYQARGVEETGRLIVWPLAFARFRDSPVVGVGLSQVGTYDASVGHEITPHNSFLFVALASGIGPLVLFLAYWTRAARAAFRGTIHGTSDKPFRIPLLLYVFVQAMGNVTFTYPWVIVAVSVAMTGGVPRMHGSRRVQAIRFRGTPQSPGPLVGPPVVRERFLRYLRPERFS